MPLKKHHIEIAQYFIVFIPAMVYFYFLNKYALDIPSQDDYVAILDFLSRWSQAHGWDKFYGIFAFHNEHRILSSRIIYVLYYKMFGTINFRHIIFIGNTQLVFIFLLLIYFIRRLLPKDWFVAALITGVALFDLNNWENTCFAMASMQNFGIVFLFLLSLFLYSLNGNLFTVMAVAVQIVCTYSSGNGIVASGFIVLFNLLNKSKLKSYTSIFALLIFAPLYFHHYDPPPTGHPSRNILQVAMFLFRFIGNHIYFNRQLTGIIAGVCVCIGLAYTTFNRRALSDSKLIPLMCLAGFLLVTMALTSVFRSNPEGYISSRYLIYPHLLFGLVLIFLLVRTQGMIRGALVVLFPVVMLIAYNMNFRGGLWPLRDRYALIKDSDYYYPDKQYAKNAADTACHLNIYCIDKHRTPKP